MKYKIITLSPIHIGNGNEISSMEYVIDDGFKRIDMDELFKDEGFNINGFIEDARFGSFYLGERYREIAEKHILYSLDISKDALGYIKRSNYNTRIREFIKTGGKPYIPGSSMKGAIRTAIMWYSLKNDDELYHELVEYIEKIWNREERKPDKKWAANEIEKMIFGNDPNHDLMRAFHVADTDGIYLKSLKIENVRIFSTKKVGYGYKHFDSIVEALNKRMQAHTTIKIDDFLIKNKEELKFKEILMKYLYDFAEICNEYAKDLIEYEINFFTKYNDGKLNQIIDFYESLHNEMNNGILLRLAWGTGWHGMTVGRLLEEDILERLRKIYNLGRRRSMPYFLKPFPKTRKIVFEDEMARYPLGWIKLEEIK